MSQNEAKEKGDDMIPDIEKQAITHFEGRRFARCGFEGDISVLAPVYRLTARD